MRRKIWKILKHLAREKTQKNIPLDYRVFDSDNNGYITFDELKRAMQMIGENVTEKQLQDMLNLADVDKDGRINYEGELIWDMKVEWRSFWNIS